MAQERAMVVGAGEISKSWIPPLIKEKVRIVAVVDIDIRAARDTIAAFGLDCPASSNLAAALSDVRPDFVVDLTVPEAHRRVTCAALSSGCHVIGEKPMASSMEDAREMVLAAERSGKLYMVSQSRRWDVRHDCLRRTIASGALGAVTTINCDFFMGCHFGGFRDKMPSPLILDMAIHHFDLARFICGADPLAVYARQFNPSGSWYAGDASACCIFEMTNGVTLTYRGSWCAEGCHTSWNGNWRIIGTKGTVIYEQDRDPRGQVLADEAGDGFNRPLNDLPVVVSPLEYSSMHGALREMLTFLREGTRPQTECHDNIKSLAMVFAAVESSRHARRVEVPTL